MQAQSQRGRSLSVNIVNKKLTIRDIVIDNEEVVQYFSEVPVDARLERLEQALAVGTVALKTMGTYERIDLIEKRFGDLSKRFDRSLEKTLADIQREVEDKFGKKGDVRLLVERYFAREGEIPKLIQEYFGKEGKIANILNEQFGKEGNLQKVVDSYFGDKGQVRKIVDDYFGEKGAFKDQLEKYIGDKGKLVDILDPTKKGTPLYALMEEIREENKNLREEIVKKMAIQAAESMTTKKGFVFEDDCYAMLCAIAKHEKPVDEVERLTTSGSKTVPGSKKGDFRINLGNNNKLRIVVEAKDYATPLSLPDIKDSLQQAMKARDAQYAIFVAKDVNALPSFIGYFNEVGNDMLVCALSSGEDVRLSYEILDVAYHWAKMQVLRKETAASKPFDAKQVVTDLNTLNSELARFQKILNYCGSIDKLTISIRAEANELKTKFGSQIAELIGKLS
jgi:hypothetical protein